MKIGTHRETGDCCEKLHEWRLDRENENTNKGWTVVMLVLKKNVLEMPATEKYKEGDVFDINR